MQRALVLATVAALALARPETYKEKEDFQYSRSSSDDGTKSGFYGAQRGNMGGNYERAHNMDSLAQNQMGGLVRTVEGELGDGAKQKSGSVFTAANSRGVYGSGNYDLSNLEGRNFQEGTTFGDSHSQLSHNAGYGSQAYGSQSHSSRYSGHQSTGSSDQVQYANNRQASDNLQSVSQYDGTQTAYNSGYQRQSGYDQTAANSHLSNAYGSNIRLVSAQPVRVVFRPGGRVVIPVAAQVDSSSHGTASAFDQNAINSEAEVLGSNGQQPYNNQPKHYESSFSYRKEWEKHDTQTVAGVPLAKPTDNPYPANSELYEDTHAQGSEHQQVASAHQQTQNVHSSNQYHGYNVKSASASQSRNQNAYNYNSQQTGAASDSGSAYVADSNAYTHGAYNHGDNLNTVNSNSQVEDFGSKPRSYQSSYSYKKSWERQGDPYVIKPVTNGAYTTANTQESQRLTSSSLNQGASSYGSQQYGSHYHQGHQGYSSHNGVDCDENGHIRVARSYNLDRNQASYQQPQQDLSQQSQNLEDFGQQSQNLEDFSQQQHQSQDQRDIGQQSQKLEDFGQQLQNLEDFSQQQQQSKDQRDIGQQSQKLEDFSQQQQSQDQRDIGQQSQKLEDFSQQQQSQDQRDIGQQSQKLEDFSQQQQSQDQRDIGQQSQKLEDFSQQQQSQDQRDIGQQSQKLEDFSQQQQSQDQRDIGQQSQKLEDFSQQQQSQDQRDIGQQSQKLEDFSQQQQSQDQRDIGQQSQKLEDFSQQQQQQSQDLQDFGQQSQNLGDLAQQSQWDQLSQSIFIPVTKSANSQFKSNGPPDKIAKILEYHNQGTRILILMRGAPGSGKTYLAKIIIDFTVGASTQNYLRHIFATDDYFMRGGIYQYNRNSQHEAHVINVKKVCEATNKGLSPIIVDNTNMKLRDMEPYVRDGVRNGYIIKIEEPNTAWAKNANQLSRKNVHGVPLDKIRQMLDKYDRNITVEHMMKHLRLAYPVNKKPPVQRDFPPYTPSETFSKTTLNKVDDKDDSYPAAADLGQQAQNTWSTLETIQHGNSGKDTEQQLNGMEHTGYTHHGSNTAFPSQESVFVIDQQSNVGNLDQSELHTSEDNYQQNPLEHVSFNQQHQQTDSENQFKQSENVGQQAQNYWDAFQSNMYQNNQNVFAPLDSSYSQTNQAGNANNQQTYFTNNTAYTNSWISSMNNTANSDYQHVYGPSVSTSSNNHYTNHSTHSQSNTHTQTSGSTSIANLWDLLDNIEKQTTSGDSFDSSYSHNQQNKENNTNFDSMQMFNENSFNTERKPVHPVAFIPSTTERIITEMGRGDIGPEKNLRPQEDVGRGDIGPDGSSSENENPQYKPLEILEIKPVQTTSKPLKTPGEIETLSLTKENNKTAVVSDHNNDDFSVLSLDEQKQLVNHNERDNWKLQSDIPKTTSTTPKSLSVQRGPEDTEQEHKYQFDNSGQQVETQQSDNQFESFDQQNVNSDQHNLDHQSVDFGQQSEYHGQELENFNQQNVNMDQQNIDHGFNMEQVPGEIQQQNMDQQFETSEQQSENQQSFNQFEEFGHQSENVGQQQQQLHNFGQQSEGQENLNNFAQQESLAEFDQQHQNLNQPQKEQQLENWGQQDANLEQLSQTEEQVQFESKLSEDLQQHTDQVETFVPPSTYHKEGREPNDSHPGKPVVEQELVTQHSTNVDTPPETVTEKVGFWNKVGSKFTSAKEKVSSWFSSS